MSSISAHAEPARCSTPPFEAGSAQAESWWLERRAVPLAAGGLLLLVSGLAHAGVWAVLGGPWEGPVTWRKPILFGISGGLTALSMGWVWSKLPHRRWDVPLAWSASLALVVEVALIDMQRWRGVASHFNRTTLLDSVLYDIMGVLILWVTLIAADLLLRSFGQRVAVPRPMLLAMRAGLVFLVVSCLLGIWVTVNGELRLGQGLEPERFGAAGVPKFPHGAVIHAIQWLPLVAWAARRAGIAEKLQERLVMSATAGTGLLLLYALVQTLAGRSRVDATPAVAMIGVVGVACLAVPAVVTFMAGWCRRHSPT
jgi:hypothetical protein